MCPSRSKSPWMFSVMTEELGTNLDEARALANSLAQLSDGQTRAQRT